MYFNLKLLMLAILYCVYIYIPTLCPYAPRTLLSAAAATGYNRITFIVMCKLCVTVTRGGNFNLHNNYDTHYSN